MRYAILAALLLAAARHAPSQRPAEDVFAITVARYEKEAGFSGAVLVARGDDVLFRGGVGHADREWGTRNDASTKFRLGSLTKGFTAALIMKLVEEGVIELNQPLTRYLKDYRRDTGDRVTIHHLLTHTSGIPSYTDSPRFHDDVRTRVDVATFVREHCSGDLQFEPGTEFRYDNGGYFLLGAVVEAVTGQRYDVALRDRVLEPLGLDDTGYDHHRAILSRRAQGYDRIAGVVVPADFIDMTVPYAAGALFSTADDLLAWHRALSDDAFLSTASRSALFHPHVASYGYGWAIGSLRLADGRSVPMISHGGGVNGSSTAIMRFPETAELIVVLGNVTGPMTGLLAEALARALHGEAAPPPPTDPMARIWARISAGDLVGARRCWAEVEPATRAAHLGSGGLDAVARALVDAGHLEEAAAVLRFDAVLRPDADDTAALLRQITVRGEAGPQFVERLDLLPGPIVWSEAVHPIDVDADGRLDLLFVNANGWRRPGDMAAPSSDPLAPTLLLNEATEDGGVRFVDRTADLLPEGFRIHGKNAAVCDVDGDGRTDIVFAVGFGARPRLLRWDVAEGRFADETEERLPALELNANGIGWGDLDDDGDLDLVLTDSGPNSDRAPGGLTRLLLNDGTGRFVDASERLHALPKIGAQNAKLVDLDGDLDLDIVLDGKSPVTHFYRNDGHASFTLELETVPTAAENGQPYEIEWADLDGDGDLDGVYMSWGGSRRETYRNAILENRLAATGDLGFDVLTDALDGRNDEDENEFALLDADDDGDLDLVAATLVSSPGEEKLYRNAGAIGTGFLRLVKGAFSHFVDGSLDLTVADFDGDGRYDVVTAQGESSRYEDFRNRYYRNMGAADTTAPRILRITQVESATRADLEAGRVAIRAAIQDATVDDGATFVRARLLWSTRSAEGVDLSGDQPMAHVGGGLHRAVLRLPAAIPDGGAISCRVLARDPMGNEATSPATTVTLSSTR